METTAPAEPLVLVLAQGDSAAAVKDARGHLFEQFAARLLELFGYEEPHRDRLNVTSDGIELDVSVRHRLTSHRAIAECKAYSTPVAAHHVSAFYGKLCKERRTDASVHGFFVAIPRLTPQGAEFTEGLEDDGLTILTAKQIRDRLLERRQISEIEAIDRFLTDRAIVITKYGLFVAAKENDSLSRTATRVVVQSIDGPVPSPALELLAASSYAQDLSVVDEALPSPAEVHRSDAPLIATVRGSGSNFEYQLPAAPRFFVGRKTAVQTLGAALSRAPGVIVLNAQSGWGKSSLALRLEHEVTKVGGHAIVVDTRTATARKGFVGAALKRAAEGAQSSGLLQLPSMASWASIPTSIATLESATWLRTAPLLLFFDQFENVFQDTELTTEFRDLALLVAEIRKPVVVGFAWKTDYIGWTEKHPYNLRDDIRNAAETVNLGKFGPRDVEMLLRRLEKELDGKLSRELRRGLQEYSQGLPWLFKKLASHVLREVRRGITQEQLVSESLNAQSLFETDLAGLSAQELESLKFVARYAPISVAEVTERVPPEVMLSLMHQRLVVQIGEKFDTYWDTFRDFLNTGRVPIEDSYTIRYAPLSVARLLKHIVDDDGVSEIADVAEREQTSENSIWNIARELRVLGASLYEPYRVRLIPEIWESSDREAALRARVATSLRRHRAYSTFRQIAERSNGKISLTAYAAALRGAFSTVEVAQPTWVTYARAFVQWFEYVGLANMESQTVSLLSEGSPGKGALFDAQPLVRIRGAFPYEHPGHCIRLLRRVATETVSFGDLQGRERRACRELAALGALTADQSGRLRLSPPDLILDGKMNHTRLLSLLKLVPGGAKALELLERDPAAAPREVAEPLREANGASWRPETMRSAGVAFRAWARQAGVATTPRRRPMAVDERAGNLLF